MLPHSSGPETFLNHHGWLFCSLPKKDDHDNRRRSNPDHVHAFQTATLLVSQPSPMMSAKDPLHANLGQSGLAQSNGAVRAFSLANPLRIGYLDLLTKTLNELRIVVVGSDALDTAL